MKLIFLSITLSVLVAAGLKPDPFGLGQLKTRQYRGDPLKDYGALNSAYPQFRDNDYSPCFNAMQEFFLNIEHTQYWFYSLLFYTDLGFKQACEESIDEGSYTQIALNLTHVPLSVPLSFCLPKECNSEAEFADLMKTATTMGDGLLTDLKKTVNFDDLYSKVANDTLNTAILRQFTALVSNDTTFTLQARIATDNTDKQQADTAAMFKGLMIFFGGLIIAFVIVPNIVMVVLHQQKLRSRNPTMLNQHILRRVAVEEELPEIKNKEKYKAFTPFQSKNDGSTRDESQMDKPSTHLFNDSNQMEGGHRDNRSSALRPPKSDYKSLFSKHSNRLGSMQTQLNNTNPNESQHDLKPRFTYTERNSIYDYISVFNFRKLYEHHAGTRTKPWDDRELDVFDGIKVWSYIVYTVAQTAFTLFLTWLNNIFTLFKMLRMLPVNSFLMSNIALEVFVFVSAFFTTYRCF